MRTRSLRVLHQFFRLALTALHVVAGIASAAFKSRAALQLENLALRHQLGFLRRSVKCVTIGNVELNENMELASPPSNSSV
jgi:hypothetical protein